MSVSLPLWESAQPLPGDPNSLFLKDGIYFSTGHSQAPVADTYFFLWAVSAPGQNINQLAMVPSTGRVYTRSYTTVDGWTDWMCFVGDGFSGSIDTTVPKTLTVVDGRITAAIDT